MKRFDLSDDAIAHVMARVPCAHRRSAYGPHSIYFIRCQSFLKIGHATDVARRIASLANANPYYLSVELQIDTINVAARAAEMYLHEHFRTKRVRGEWFRLSPLTLKKIEPRLRTVVSTFENFAWSRSEATFAEESAGRDSVSDTLAEYGYDHAVS